ncbi:MAG: hypothetical protein HC886_11685 [Leptolyngbyaceae cyanobacterium SM1_1_3]|nr:hypothetical protein [Leptolyngbyaceae cyanobacterium SM1_1_3]NJM85040.1 hypothetical protein [Leptolyngbyaceae cyanobacterium RM2_2_21]NJN03954.1 hypothetical protein [Leptolyngbyaceae cyanobacterium RM1_1_2]NJO09425.1 hypothetical protein [Leptolyngbyaceae cyanobacterium SL_1_1]
MTPVSTSAGSANPPQPDSLAIESILGVAIFDLNGLPQEYYTTPDNPETKWVQTVFQALGLKSLLMASLRLEGFQHILIQTDEHKAVVVRQKNLYTALLLHQPKPEAITEAFLAQVRQFETHTLRSNPRFTAA